MYVCAFSYTNAYIEFVYFSIMFVFNTLCYRGYLQFIIISVQNKAKITNYKLQITNYKLLINLESAVYRLKCKQEKKLRENCSIAVTRLHHSIQAAFNKTIISILGRKLPQSNVTKPSRKLNSSSTNDTICS